jgi:hypothetical protein
VSAPVEASTISTSGTIVETRADITRRVTAESSATRTRSSGAAASAGSGGSSFVVSSALMVE